MLDVYDSGFHATVSHFLAQLIFRDIPLSGNGSSSTSLFYDRPFKETDWQRAIEYSVQETPEQPWVAVFQRLPLSGRRRLYSELAHNFEHLRRENGFYLQFYHPLFPHLLKCLSDSPKGLFFLGDPDLLSMPTVSVIGARQCSYSTRITTEEMSRKLAKAEYCTVSGGALGTDIAAHYGVLDSGLTPAPTMVIMAGGLSKFYPQSNRVVFDAVRSAGGLFVSERLWDAPCRRYDYPIRNRIISGLSSHLFVMQAAQKSGSFVTAKLALEQGREVWCLRQPPNDVRASGSRQLIEEGARCFTGREDLVSLINSSQPLAALD